MLTTVVKPVETNVWVIKFPAARFQQKSSSICMRDLPMMQRLTRACNNLSRREDRTRRIGDKRGGTICRGAGHRHIVRDRLCDWASYGSRPCCGGRRKVRFSIRSESQPPPIFRSRKLTDLIPQSLHSRHACRNQLSRACRCKVHPILTLESAPSCSV